MLSRKNKNIVKIEDVITTKEQKDKINDYRKSHSNGWHSNHIFANYLRTVLKIEGLCCMCGSLPDKKIYYNSGLVERYCNNCIDHVKDDLKTNRLNEKLIIKKYDGFRYVEV